MRDRGGRPEGGGGALTAMLGSTFGTQCDVELVWDAGRQLAATVDPIGDKSQGESQDGSRGAVIWHLLELPGRQLVQCLPPLTQAQRTGGNIGFGLYQGNSVMYTFTPR